MILLRQPRPIAGSRVPDRGEIKWDATFFRDCMSQESLSPFHNAWIDIQVAMAY